MTDENTSAHRVAGGFLCTTALLGAAFWLLIVLKFVIEPSGTFSLGGFTGSTRRDALMATPAAITGLTCQFLFGLGLWRRRPWTVWFGGACIGIMVLGRVAAPHLSSAPWISLALPMIGLVPISALLWSRRHPAALQPSPRQTLVSRE
ncbi:hypothetical protein V3331_18020 [Gaopeijia maritima]|uniref:hypothetical protein n=1 Tax=Gaopeijia maritima TaxID=3119007 RepID=UPI00324C01AE